MADIPFPISSLPPDWRSARLVGRIDAGEGPTPVLLREGRLLDLSRIAPTVSHLLAAPAFAGGDLAGAQGVDLGPAEEVLARVRLLSPVDLHCIKAAGVTFALSAVERVIEERARGRADVAAAIRERLEARIGASIRAVVPGSAAAAELKAALIEDGVWSQYLEVAIGPDAEIFTKAPVLASVGWGDEIGVRSDSAWNNPEPEIVLVVDAAGNPVGATLGNDVNLRDFEGRSALLLGKAKDNNASCAIGPFIRLFDQDFTMDDVRAATVDLHIVGEEGFELHGQSSMDQISRDPTELIRQALSEHHYPDGFVLFLGTLFAPVQDRDAPGAGFTHRIGDLVTISSARLGRLANRVNTAKAAPAWTLGIAGLMGNLAGRGLL